MCKTTVCHPRLILFDCANRAIVWRSSPGYEHWGAPKYYAYPNLTFVPQSYSTVPNSTPPRSILFGRLILSEDPRVPRWAWAREKLGNLFSVLQADQLGYSATKYAIMRELSAQSVITLHRKVHIHMFHCPICYCFIIVT